MLKGQTIFFVFLFYLPSFSFSSEKLVVLSDTHYFGPHALSKELLKQKINISLGDIFDRKWTLKNEVIQASKEQKEFSEFCKKKGVIEIDGNHDLKSDLLFYVKNGVLFTHGHYVSWDQKTIDKKEKSSKNGVLQKARDVFLTEEMAHPYGTLSKRKIQKAVMLARKYNCHTIVFGHTHVEKLIDMKVDGVRIINVPRGLTSIEV